MMIKSYSIDITQSEEEKIENLYYSQGELKFPDKKPKGRPINVTYTMTPLVNSLYF